MGIYGRLLTIAAITCGLGVLTVAAPVGRADVVEESKAKEPILKISARYEKKELDDAKKDAKEYAKQKEADLSEVMKLFRLRSNGGLGVGDKGLLKSETDGMDTKLNLLMKSAMDPKNLTKQKDALIRMGHVMAAIGEVSYHKCPIDTKQGTRDPDEWRKWCDEMRTQSLEFAEAVAGQKPGEVRTAAAKLSRTCEKCHKAFKMN